MTDLPTLPALPQKQKVPFPLPSGEGLGGGVWQQCHVLGKLNSSSEDREVSGYQRPEFLKTE